MRVILPNRKASTALAASNTLPFFFLAGPVLGAGEWHFRLCEALRDRIGDFFVAIPRRYDGLHPLWYHQVPHMDGEFERQLPWERDHMFRAAYGPRPGCLIFWLPEELRNDPRRDGLPYAMDTRGEIGEWRGRMAHSGALRVLIGAEPGFPGLDVISRNFELALGRRMKILSSIEDLADSAAEIAGATSAAAPAT